jgi:hypothetical protein
MVAYVTVFEEAAPMGRLALAAWGAGLDCSRLGWLLCGCFVGGTGASFSLWLACQR